MRFLLDSGIIVAKPEPRVIQSGDNKGEKFYTLSISDGVDVLTDLRVSVEGLNQELFDKLEVLKPYRILVDYSVKSFGNTVYRIFSIVSILPVPVK